jgi:ribosome-binding factor A
MTSRRLLKAAEAIREVVSMAILTEMKDPRVRNVTVTKVEVAPDMRQAKVFVSVMGSDADQKLTVRGLQHAAGFLQAKINDRIDTRYTPRLQFVLDMGVKKSLEIAQILNRVLSEDDAAEGSPTAEADAAEDEESAGDSVADDADDEPIPDDRSPPAH